MSAGELADTLADPRLSRRLNVLRLCAGALALAGLLAAFFPLAAGSLPPSTKSVLFYSGFLAVLLGGGSLFAVERYRLKQMLRDGSGAAAGREAAVSGFAHETEFDRLKNALVSVASHELRTPLNGILGYAQILHALATSTSTATALKQSSNQPLTCWR